MNIIDTDLLKIKQISIPDGTTQEQWAEIHRSLLVCKKSAAKWLSQSRSFASDRWGVDYVAETEVQLELGLGFLDLTQPEPGPLNPEDKTSGIVTIEGLSQKFVIWQRKMSEQIERWDDDRLKRALDLLEPMEQQAKRIRELLGK
jgi:hypothetical protein